MTIALIIAGLVILTATIFIGGLITVIKAGEKEGISDYGYKQD